MLRECLAGTGLLRQIVHRDVDGARRARNVAIEPCFRPVSISATVTRLTRALSASVAWVSYRLDARAMQEVKEARADAG